MSVETRMNAGVKSGLKIGSTRYGRTAEADFSAGRTGSIGSTGSPDFLDTFGRALKESRKSADPPARISKKDRNQEKGNIKKPWDKTSETGDTHNGADQKTPDDAMAVAAGETLKPVEAREAAVCDKNTAPVEMAEAREARLSALTGDGGGSGMTPFQNIRQEALLKGNNCVIAMKMTVEDAAGTGNNEETTAVFEKIGGTIQAAGNAEQAGVRTVSEQVMQNDIPGIRAELSGRDGSALINSKMSAQKQDTGMAALLGADKGSVAAELLKSQSAESLTQQTGGQMAESGNSGQAFSDMLKDSLKDSLEATTNADSAKSSIAGDSREAEAAGDNQLLEEFKRSADGRTGSFMNRLAEAGMNRGVMTVQKTANSFGQLETPVAEQLKSGIEQGLKRELQEFTIKLKPEGLGDIVVHMATAGGRTAVRIGASNPETERLINSQMVNLKEMLEPLHAEVEEVYHNSQGAMEFAQFGQEMYQKQGRYGAAHGRHFQEDDAPDDGDDIRLETRRMIEEIRDGRLYAYV